MNRLRLYRVMLLACCAIATVAAGVWADNWPGWRGPDHNGVSKETRLPVQWSDTKNIAWKLPRPGMGGSTPAIWGDRLFLTSADGQSVVLLCVDTSGKMLWKRQVSTGSKVF